MPERPVLRELAVLRAILESEVPQRLHSETSREAEYAHGLGRPFTPEFRRYLSHPEQWGSSRLGMLSILEVADWCGQRHPQHRRGSQMPLCGAVLVRAAYWGHTPPPALDRLLRNALRVAAEWRAAQNRVRLEEPLPYQKLPRLPAGSARMRRDGRRRRMRPKGKISLRK